MGKRKFKGHWKDFENVRSALEEMIEKLGHFPLSGDLNKKGLFGLKWAINEHHGGLGSVREIMGYEGYVNPVRKPKGFWSNFDNLEMELRPIVEQEGHLPSEGELFDMGKRSLTIGIEKQGGYEAVAKKLGCRTQSNRKPPGYWDNLDNIKRELLDVKEKLGYFPDSGDLRRLKKHQLIKHIGKQGGIPKLRFMIEGNYNRKPAGYWKDFENVRRELEQVTEKIGHFPTEKELIEIGRQDLSGAIKSSGGFPAVRQRMGVTLLKTPNNYLKDIGNLREGLDPIINKLGYLPSHTELVNLGREDLIRAINVHHGGFSNLSLRLGVKYDGKSTRKRGYWRDFENIRKELGFVMDELGHFPTTPDLIELGRKDLISAFNYHGGINHVAQKMGQDNSDLNKPRGYWKDFENFRKELESVIENLGEFPSQDTLSRMGMYTLNGAFRYFGGREKIKQRLGYSDYIPEELEEEFSLKIEDDENAFEILRHFSDDPKDAADLLRVLNPDQFPASTYRILSLGNYLGKFRAGGNGIPQDSPDELIEGLENLIDANELARNIIRRKAFQLYEQKYILRGDNTLRELEQKVADSEGNLQAIYQEVYEDLRDLDSYEIPGVTSSLGE